MRVRIRCLLVMLLSLGFVLGGFGRVALAVSPGAPCHSQHHPSVPQSHDAHAGHSDSHAHAAHHQNASDPSHAPAESECFKCCGSCTAAPSLAVSGAPTQWDQIAFPISYFEPVATFTDRPLLVDPGIPKRIA